MFENMRKSKLRVIKAFADTNSFIQCNDIDQIKFSDILGEFDELEILVAEPVLDEID